ncbi:MAG: XdhC family protein [Anaerolineae bacterium]|nr:XdhC family protein [Anaerolineae bacterium]
MLEILETVNRWLEQGRRVALATVVDTWGSAPRGVGAKMAVAADMAMIGSVSGGCVENAVIQEAVESLADGKPRLLSFGVSDDTAWDVGLACGGKITVFVEPLDTDWWWLITGRIRQNIPVVTVTIVKGDTAGQKILLGEEKEVLYATVPDPDQLIQTAHKQPQSKRVPVGDFEVLVDVHIPRPRLIIVGGVHVAIPLQFFAAQLGFDVVLIDPRKAFASPERFPGIKQVFHSYPDKALPQVGLTKDTYIAVLTHDPKIDDLALKTALPSDVPYVGVLSSKRTHERRLERLTRAGVDSHLLTRIRTPIGLEIGAKTPEEIALCIMAEIVAVRNGAKA